MTYTVDLRNPIPLLEHALAFKLVEDTPTTVEARVNDCLRAKPLCEADAADIGYACMCHTEFAAVPAFNPKMKLLFTKTVPSVCGGEAASRSYRPSGPDVP